MSDGDRRPPAEFRPLAIEKAIADWKITSEDEMRRYYYSPSVGKYYGVAKDSERVYYCAQCKREIQKEEIFEISVGRSGHKRQQKAHRIRHGDYDYWTHFVKMVEKRPRCEAFPCPICGKLSSSDGYCSPQHQEMMLNRLLTAYESVEEEP